MTFSWHRYGLVREISHTDFRDIPRVYLFSVPEFLLIIVLAFPECFFPLSYLMRKEFMYDLFPEYPFC